MSLQTSQPGSNRLPVLAATINEHLEAAEAATRRGLEHAIAVGALLIEAKELVAHGEWLPWLQANCRVCLDAIRRYVPDTVLADFEARRVEAQIEARAEIARLLGGEE
jgi:Protein of unknown function (DUF3102)